MHVKATCHSEDDKNDKMRHHGMKWRPGMQLPTSLEAERETHAHPVISVHDAHQSYIICQVCLGMHVALNPHTRS